MPNGKNKGNAFERKICVMLSKWWSNGLLGSELTDVFWRTSSSGGRATQRGKTNKRTKGQYGDICATDPLGQPLIDFLTLELKCGYNSHSFADIIDKPPNAKKTMYEKWFEKAERDSKASGSFGWMLIVQRTRRLPMVFTPYRIAHWLGIINGDYGLSGEIEYATGVVNFVTLLGFLKNVQPNNIVKLVKEHEKEKQC